MLGEVEKILVMEIEILYSNRTPRKHNILYIINNIPQYIVDKHIYFMIKFNSKYDNKFLLRRRLEMNILVIGNGFDLAHGLPTKYTDFLHFVQIYEESYKKEFVDLKEIIVDSNIKKYITDLFNSIYNDDDPYKDKENKPRRERAEKLIQELYNLIHNNIWIEYFTTNPIYQKENWIDFESEISNVIKSLDNDMKNNNESLDSAVSLCSNPFLSNKFCSYLDEMKSTMYTYRIIRDKLLGDLNKLIHTFEIYLVEYVEKIDCKLMSPDIQQILLKESMEVSKTSVCNGMLLSFNYTNTCERLYMEKVDKYLKKDIIDYIHGKADINNTI